MQSGSSIIQNFSTGALQEVARSSARYNKKKVSGANHMEMHILKVFKCVYLKFDSKFGYLLVMKR